MGIVRASVYNLLYRQLECRQGDRSIDLGPRFSHVRQRIEIGRLGLADLVCFLRFFHYARLDPYSI